jgi:hypothetical protein
MFETIITNCVNYTITDIRKDQMKGTAVLIQIFVNEWNINKYLNYCMEQKDVGKRKENYGNE